MDYKRFLFGIPVFLSILTIPLFFHSCANYQRPEKLRQTMKYMEPKVYKEKPWPAIALMDVNFTHRGVASKVKEDEEIVNTSNRELYFLTLLQQFNVLKSYMGERFEKRIKFCPNFHTTYLTYKEDKRFRMVRKDLMSEYPAEKNVQKNNPGLYPELSMSVSLDRKEPSVFNYLSNNQSEDDFLIFKKAYNNHLQRIYLELSKLCTNGESDNYVVFVNLIAYMENHKDFKNNMTALTALLKTTVLKNRAIITSLAAQFDQDLPFFSKALNQEVLRRLQANWSEAYFAKLRKEDAEDLISDNQGLFEFLLNATDSI